MAAKLVAPQRCWATRMMLLVRLPFRVPTPTVPSGVLAHAQSVSLKALADQVAQEREQLEHGVYDEDVRAIPRWQAQELVPSSQLRPGAEKQMLKEEEEDALELVRT